MCMCTLAVYLGLTVPHTLPALLFVPYVKSYTMAGMLRMILTLKDAARLVRCELTCRGEKHYVSSSDGLVEAALSNQRVV